MVNSGPRRAHDYRVHMHSIREGVASTALLVAAIRAGESIRDDRLFTDPFAATLAGDEGRRLLATAVAATGEQSTVQIVIRTRYWDDALLRSRTGGASQVVILAAGMDARAYRLPWPADTTIYEVDQPGMITTKDELLAGQKPRCTRITIGTDLADDWPNALHSQGFSPANRTVWLVEGLLQYLDERAVRTLFHRIDALSAPGSVLLYEVVGKTLLDASFLKPTLEFMNQLGAPWIFGTDEPAALVEHLGWTAAVTDVAEPGYAWNRWPVPAAPLSVPGVPRGYFIEATKDR
jgi:methyltransferase (TIGR00027 family)